MAHEGDVIQVLETDNREVREMWAQVQALPATDPKRRELADGIIKELVRHSIAEETYVYPAVREKFPNGASVVDKETAEHAEAERAMKELERVEHTDPQFDLLITHLMTTIEDHIRDEESNLFPTLRSLSTQDELDQLATKVNAIKAIAPTRPHPAAPDHPLSHKLLGPGIGLVDRARDLFSGR